MKVYIDLLLFINLFFDYILLFSTGKLTKEIISYKRIFISSILGSLTTFLLFIPMNSVLLFFIKIFISVIMIYISFGYRNILKNLGQFYINSIILGGSLYLLNLEFSIDNNNLFINLFIFIILVPILFIFYIKDKKKLDLDNSIIYHTEIYINKKVYKVKSILDTGNTLIDQYKKRPILIVNSSFDIKYPDKFIYVPYKALNSNGVIKCYSLDKVVINNREFYNCLVGVSNDELSMSNINCILPGKFKEEL